MFLQRKRISPWYSKTGNGVLEDFAQDFSIFHSSPKGLNFDSFEGDRLYKNIKKYNEYFLDACEHCIEYHAKEIDNFAECAFDAFTEITDPACDNPSKYKNIDFDRDTLGMRLVFYKYSKEDPNFNIQMTKNIFYPYILRCEIYIPVTKLYIDTYDFEKYNCLLNEEIDIAKMMFVDLYENKNRIEIKHKPVCKPLSSDYIQKGFRNFIKNRGLDNCIQNKLIKKFCNRFNKKDIEEFIKAEHLLLEKDFDFEKNPDNLTILSFGNIPDKYEIDFKECIYD